MTLNELYKIIKNRQQKMPPNSYVADLFKAGKDKIIEKVIEENGEVIKAVKEESKQRIVSELADLYFHLLVLMALSDISPDDVLSELEKRRKK